MSHWKTIYVIRFDLTWKQKEKQQHERLGSISNYLIGAFAFILITYMAIRNWIVSNTFHRRLNHTIKYTYSVVRDWSIQYSSSFAGYRILYGARRELTNELRTRVKETRIDREREAFT